MSKEQRYPLNLDPSECPICQTLTARSRIGAIRCSVHSMKDVERLLGMRKLNDPKSGKVWGHTKKSK